MSAVAATAAVQAEASVDVADTQDAPISRPFGGLQIGYPFAGVFGDLFSARERDGRKTSFAVDW